MDKLLFHLKKKKKKQLTKRLRIINRNKTNHIIRDRYQNNEFVSSVTNKMIKYLALIMSSWNELHMCLSRMYFKKYDKIN